jgi:hypothetical protein
MVEMVAARPSDAPRPLGSRSLLRDLAPVAVAFALATLLLFAAAWQAGADPLSSVVWGRWDSSLYLYLANHGDTFASCPAPYPPGLWCGSAGWFPGYSLLLAPLFSLGLPQMLTAVVVSWAFDFGMLAVLWRGYLQQFESPVRYVALLFAATAPAGVYLRAVFPMSMAAFFVVAALLLMRRSRPLWAAAMIGVAGFCYLSTAAVAVILVPWTYLATRGRSTGERVALTCAAAVLACCGVVASLVFAQLQTGHWNAYFLIQAHYGHTLTFPFVTLVDLLRQTFGGPAYAQALAMSRYGAVTEGIEALLAATIALGSTVAVGMLMLRRRATLWDGAVLCAVLLFWLIPLTQANLSYWRGDTLLVPAALLLPRMPRWLAVALTGVTIVVFGLLTVTFFEGTLR